MAIPLPNLDDRRWADLVDEGQALIPFFAPAWTDHNAHDPGITVVDLLAWITESDIYRLNQIPEAHRRKFLKLAGERPRPPRAARTVAQFESFKCTPPIVLPAWTELEANDVYGTRTPFRTTVDLTVVPSAIATVQVHERGRYRDLTLAWQRGEPIALLGADPQVGSELYLGLSQDLPPQVWATIAIALEGPASGAEERRRLRELAVARDAMCRTPPSLLWCDPGQRPPSPEPDISQHHSARTAWEVAIGSNRWRRLASPGELRDDTRAFTLDGAVQIRLAAPAARIAVGEIATPYHYLRCRLIAGRLDAPPRATVIALNATWIEQEAPPPSPRTPDEKSGLLVERGLGAPEQQLRLADPPIVESSVSVETRESNAAPALTWTRRDDFDASNATDAHFVLDPTAGTVTFGDGERGRVVPDGARITVRYLTTRGEAGNLARNTALRVVGEVGWRISSGHTVLAAIGGAAAEDVVHAEGRTLEKLATSGRAITAEDYGRVARHTPGTQIARAIALPNRHPRHPCIRASGMVTVVIVPFLPAARPVPTCELRAQVRAQLDRWRLIGTRVEVIGPVYVEVSVRATVQAAAGVDRTKLGGRIATALDDFFHPLRGGAEGTGWPLGRDVYRAEILQVIDDVADVDHVVALALVQGDGPPVCGNICLGSTGLVAVRPHQIEVV